MHVQIYNILINRKMQKMRKRMKFPFVRLTQIWKFVSIGTRPSGNFLFLDCSCNQDGQWQDCPWVLSLRVPAKTKPAVMSPGVRASSDPNPSCVSRATGVTVRNEGKSAPAWVPVGPMRGLICLRLDNEGIACADWQQSGFNSLACTN